MASPCKLPSLELSVAPDAALPASACAAAENTVVSVLPGQEPREVANSGRETATAPPPSFPVPSPAVRAVGVSMTARALMVVGAAALLSFVLWKRSPLESRVRRGPATSASAKSVAQPSASELAAPVASAPQSSGVAAQPTGPSLPPAGAAAPLTAAAPRPAARVSRLAAASARSAVVPGQRPSALAARVEPAAAAVSVGAGPEAELALLRKAQQALSHAPRAAQTYLDAHASNYPDGLFVQEREMLRIELSVLDADHTRSQVLARSFVNQFPGSTYQARIDALLATDSKIEREVAPAPDTQRMDPTFGGRHVLGRSH